MRSTRGPEATWRERGAAAVEMAIVLPLLLLVIAGIVDFGRFFLTELTLSTSAREGARVAVIDPSNAVARAQAAGFSGMTVDVGTCVSTLTGNQVTVTVTDPTFEWLLIEPAMSFFGASSVSLPAAKAKAVMRCES